ncbi:ribokinase [Virgibacillus sp. AGTR]|uniref:ribokinase n=1 Tax=Virgibacillus sp. AGTR TaxID=2812055 RepID=UPI0019665E51|nr:ribokinase [Virgibacillus sp. AGTR]MCC2250915.1 ribokinase [Virgibacillus sp. AGTR]QRZ16365.1 ribokinase [Virgibacillus sp. AGTR]
MTNKPIVTIIGSINMDLTITTQTMPMQGETVLGKHFSTFPGGKGANQAVAAARLGANVNMIGMVGADAFGDKLSKHLRKEGINDSGISIDNEASTGIANIILSENDNRIIVVPGANYRLSPNIIDQHRHLIKESDVVLVQLEIPMETVNYTVQVAKEFQVPVILNPAPYQDLPDELLELATYLTPNEIEAEALNSNPLFMKIQEKIIMTQGEKGVHYFLNGKEYHIPSYQVGVKDTTGAGDTFNGALAAQLGQGHSLPEAIRFSTAAAALSVSKIGAQGGMPTKQMVEQFLQERGSVQ